MNIVTLMNNTATLIKAAEIEKSLQQERAKTTPSYYRIRALRTELQYICNTAQNQWE